MTGGELTFAPLTAADVPGVKALILRVMAEFDLADGGRLDGELAAALADGEGLLVTAKKGSRLLGCGALAPLDVDDAALAPVCELRRMYLDRAARGAGVGRKLLDYLIDQARTDGYRHCYLETAPQLQAAKHLYRQFGFKPIEHPLGETGHKGCPDFFLLPL